MNSALAVPKITAALELLERGIELYLRGDSYYSSLHLAGAAEEVFAVYVRDFPPEPASVQGSASDQLQEAFIALYSPASAKERKAAAKWFHDRTYDAKNSVKHKRGRSDHSLDFEPKEEAAELLELAVSTYFQLFSRTNVPYLRCIEDFDRERRDRKPADEA